MVRYQQYHRGTTSVNFKSTCYYGVGTTISPVPPRVRARARVRVCARVVPLVPKFYFAPIAAHHVQLRRDIMKQKQKQVKAKTLKQTRQQADVLAAAEKFREKPNPDKLRRLRSKVAEARDLSLTISDLMSAVKEEEARLLKIRTVELPALFEEIGISNITLDASGNNPECYAELATFYSANLPKDERADKAFKKFKWLAPLSRHTISLDFAKGEEPKAKKLMAVLKKQKLKFKDKVGVHASTLTAEIRRRYEDGQPLSPADLDLLGATVGTIVKLNIETEDEGK